MQHCQGQLEKITLQAVLIWDKISTLHGIRIDSSAGEYAEGQRFNLAEINVLSLH